MTDHRFDREALLIGQEKLNKLKNASVIVFGLGGVGGYTVEALCRGGVGSISIVDGDVVDVTNINRQIIALDSTVGLKKTEAWKKRLLDINPSCRVLDYDVFYGRDNEDIFDFSSYDYVIDAVDTVTSKLLIIKKASTAGVKVISSMGTARKLDPTRLKLGDIYDTSGCPLARVVRREVRKLGISSLPVVWSDEPAAEQAGSDGAIGSVSFVPSVAGLIIAGKVISDISQIGGLYEK